MHYTELMKRIFYTLSLIALTLGANAQKTWILGGGTSNGNWSNAAAWSGGTVPTASDSVVINISTNSGVTITIDANATCGALYLIGSGSVASTGPTLQYASTGTISLTVTGGLNIGGGSGTNMQGGRPKFTSNGNSNATLILNGYDGVTYTSSGSNTIANGSAGFNMNEGNVRIIGTGTANYLAAAGFRVGSLTIGDGVNSKTLSYNQGSASTISLSALTIKTGSTFNLGGNNTNSPSIGSNTVGVVFWTGGLTIESGATLALQAASGANSAFFNIAGGNIINNGTMNLFATNRTLTVQMGVSNLTTGSQSIGGANPIAFNNLTISNTAGDISINTPVSVQGALTLTAGKVFTTASNIINCTSTATLSGGSTSSFVSGPFSYTWNTSTATKTYPLGKGSLYRPLVLSLTTPASPAIVAEVFNAAPGGTLTGGIVSQNFYYQTSLLSGTAATGGTAQINFNTATDGVSNTATLGVGQASTASGAYTNIGNSVNTATNVTSNSYNPASGNFLALVSTSGNTLPVKWASFTATKNTDASILRWSTASEINNSHFEVQRSADGKSFEAIGKVKGTGNSSKTMSYSFSDKDAATSKTTYYRLKQVDFDGKSEFSRTVSIVNTTAKAGIGNTLPNPFSSDLNITVNATVAASATIIIMDMIGKTHHTSTEQLQAGANTINVNTTDMPDGIYFVRVSYNGETFTQKIVKK